MTTTSGTRERIGLLPAAGMARRLGIETPKELLVFEGRRIIDWSVRHLVEAGVDRIVVVIREDKESIADHLVQVFPETCFEFTYQHGDIGNLLDALKVAAPRLGAADVLFCFPDTRIEPNPFGVTVQSAPSSSLTVHCFVTEKEWANFGVIDEFAHRIVDKPSEFVGTTCWGALEWTAEFTAMLSGADDLTELMNTAGFTWRESLDRYIDIGIDLETAGLDEVAA